MLIGARPGAGDTTAFRVWAPRARTVEVLVHEHRHRLAPENDGYFSGEIARCGVGSRYGLLLDGRGPFADPASRAQPEGPEGPSAVVDARAVVPADWRGRELTELVICEIHVGTFTEEGTFDAVASDLDELASDGYSAIELMPVATFPGDRNWGYDGVLPFAVHEGYGGAAGLVRLVEAAHRHGLAVLVDVVYNHLGPRGAPHDHFGPYRTTRYTTPWGEAMNFDGPGSDAVRDYFVAHARYLTEDLGADGLRLDAVHAIADSSEVPFLAELCAAVHERSRRLGRTVLVIAESAADDARVTAAASSGGLGFDAQWDDDFHHALRVSLTGDASRYFADMRGLADLGTALREAFVRPGSHSVVHGRRHGRALATPLRGEQMVVYAQNHDQVTNGGLGERLVTTLGHEVDYLLAAIVLLSPYVPLRFMGEEYGERAPFHFFTAFGGGALADAVRRGRALEVGNAGGFEPPDPEDPETFAASRLARADRLGARGRALRAWQRELLALRRSLPALAHLAPSAATVETDEDTAVVSVLRPGGDVDVGLVAHVGLGEVELAPAVLGERRRELLAAHGASLAGRTVRLGDYGVAVVGLRAR